MVQGVSLQRVTNHRLGIESASPRQPFVFHASLISLSLHHCRLTQPPPSYTHVPLTH